MIYQIDVHEFRFYSGKFIVTIVLLSFASDKPRDNRPSVPERLFAHRRGVDANRQNALALTGVKASVNYQIKARGGRKQIWEATKSIITRPGGF